MDDRGGGTSTRSRRSSSSSPKKSAQEGHLVWSIVKSQFQALCKTLSGAGVESLVLTSQGFQYCGSEQGVKFLQDKIGLVSGLKLDDKQSASKPKGEKSALTWEIVETQFAALVKTLSDMGVESLILTSIMTDKSGFSGSNMGLKFLKDNPKVPQLFKKFCADPDSLKIAKNSKSSVFGKWYSLFPEEDADNSLEELESSSQTEEKNASPSRVSSRRAQKEKETPRQKDSKTPVKEKATESTKKTVPKKEDKEKQTPLAEAKVKQTSERETPKSPSTVGLAAGRSKRNIIKKKHFDDEDDDEEVSPKKKVQNQPRKSSHGEEVKRQDKKEPETPKRGRGPRKDAEESDKKDKTSVEDDVEEEDEEKTPKRGRGRPKGTTKSVEKVEEKDEDTNASVDGKRKSTEKGVEEEEKTEASVKKNKKSIEKELEDEENTGASVKKKSAEKEEEKEDNEEATVSKRGRGRPPKHKEDIDIEAKNKKQADSEGGKEKDEQVKETKDATSSKGKKEDENQESGVVKRGRGRPPKSEETKTTEEKVQSKSKVLDEKAKEKVSDEKAKGQSVQAKEKSSEENTPVRQSTRLAEIRIKEEPDTSEYERRASGRKKAIFECSECQEIFFMEYLLIVHQRKCKREARLLGTPKSATPSSSKKAKKTTVESKNTPGQSFPEVKLLASIKKEVADADEGEVRPKVTKEKPVECIAIPVPVETEKSKEKVDSKTTETEVPQRSITVAAHTLITANEQDAEMVEAIVKDAEIIAEHGAEIEEAEMMDDDSDWDPRGQSEHEHSMEVRPIKRKRSQDLSQAKRMKGENKVKALKYKEILDILNIKRQVEGATQNEEGTENENQEEGASNENQTEESNEDQEAVQNLEIHEAKGEEAEAEEDKENETQEEMTENEAANVVEQVLEATEIEFVEPGEDDYLDVATIESMVDLDSSVCAICGMRFKDSKYMRKHLITHSATKNYECEVCTKKFMRRYDLHQHLMRIHAWVKTGRGTVVDQKGMIRERNKQLREENSLSEEQEVAEGGLVVKKEPRDVVVATSTDFENGLEEGEVHVHLSVTEREEGEVSMETVNAVNSLSMENVSKVLADDNVIIDNRRKQIGTYECPYCYIVCNTRLSLDQHLERVHEDQLAFECKDCEAKFNKYAKLQRHISATHTEKRYGCSVCGKLFKYFYTCKEHEKIHTDAKAHLCDLCGKGFSLLKYLMKHKERHQQEGLQGLPHEKLFPCKYCNKVFDDLRLYQNHMRQHTDVEDRIHHCDQCPKRFFKATHLKRHMLTHTNIRLHKCDICEKSYKDKDTLRKHQKYYHPPDEESREIFPCPHCEKIFYNKGHLKRHLVKHTGEKPFICPTCNKGFGEKKSLENHIRIHTGERPYKCDQCDKAFIQLSHLRRHKFLHSQVRDVKCEECGKCFFEKADLQKHMRVHTKDRPYKCDLCPMSFAQQNILKCHRRRHTGEKPYVCDICDRAFTQMGAMQCHRRLHTGERPYKCKYCGMGFVSKERMKFHTYSHTGINPHICHICGKGFRLKFKLQSHLDSHEGVFRHQCNYCSKGFIEKAKLSRHIKQVHTDVDGNEISYPKFYRPTVIDGKEIGEDGVITVITTRAPVNDDQEEPIVEYVTQMPVEESQVEEEVEQEVVETVTVPFDTEANSAISHIQFEGDSEVTQATAANLAALYAGETTHITMPSDSIIYQGDGENGEEVVYVVIPEDNQTVILS